MTCSPRLYFIDAARALAQRGLKIVLLLVGDSALLPAIRDRARATGDVVRVVGQIPYDEVLPYFMASDVGLNVVDDDPYYHLQSPLKIFEYAALGKPVLVAPWLDEVARNKLSNVTFCEDNATSLAEALARLHSRGMPTIEVDLDRYDWGKLTRELETILTGTIERVARRVPSASGDTRFGEAAIPDTEG
jgi:glycosyltransferase involved in cell wall biosynthesis